MAQQCFKVIQALLLVIVSGFSISCIEAGRYCVSRKLASASKSSSYMPSSVVCDHWKLLGLFQKRELKQFIQKPQLHTLFKEWFVLQRKNKMLAWERFHNHLKEFYLEEEMRDLWGKEPVKTIQDEQIYLKLALFLDSLKRNERQYGEDRARYAALLHLNVWYSPLINISVEEKDNETEFTYASDGMENDSHHGVPPGYELPLCHEGNATRNSKCDFA